MFEPAIRRLLWGVLSCFSVSVMAADVQAPHEVKDDSVTTTVTLFNGVDLTGWTPYLAENNVSSSNVWKVEDGELICSGDGPGYIRTDRVYHDYILEVEWRWLKKPDTRDDAYDCGVFLHLTLPDKIWPRVIEAQLHSGMAGDLLTLSGATCDQIAELNPPGIRVPRAGASAERPVGEWNLYRIICRGDTIQAAVNGVHANSITGCDPQKGMIGLQSEGFPLAFRTIRLLPLDSVAD